MVAGGGCERNRGVVKGDIPEMSTCSGIAKHTGFASSLIPTGYLITGVCRTGVKGNVMGSVSADGTRTLSNMMGIIAFGSMPGRYCPAPKRP